MVKRECSVVYIYQFLLLFIYGRFAESFCKHSEFFYGTCFTTLLSSATEENFFIPDYLQFAFCNYALPKTENERCCQIEVGA